MSPKSTTLKKFGPAIPVKSESIPLLAKLIVEAMVKTGDDILPASM